MEVPGHSYYFKAEKMARKDENLDKITKEIKGVCADLGLEIFNQKQFFKYIDRLNKKANEIFDYTTHSQNYFKNTFGL